MKLGSFRAAIALLLILAGLSGCTEVPIPTIDVKTASTIQGKGGLLLDVRELDEYTEVHIPDITLIPLGRIKSRLNEIIQYKDRPVAVIDRAGLRSARAVELLLKLGFSQAVSVQGGMEAWQAAGLPLKKITDPPEVAADQEEVDLEEE